MALGAAGSTRLARTWGKPRVIRFGTMLSLASGAALAALGLSGAAEGGGFAGTAGFAVLHAAYWLGNGIVLPTATSMMADAAEARRERAGLRREGLYAALFSRTPRMSTAGGLMASGVLLHALGFASGGVRPSAAPTLLFAAMCLAGPALQAAGLRLSRIDGRPR
jgi:Na+/melibiose symporter-like transporter